MSTPDTSGVSAHSDAVPAAAGPTPALWLNILRSCVVVTLTAIAVLAAAAAIAEGGAGALSAVFGYAVVVLFFGISLLVGHFAGRNNPSGAIGLFAVTYAIKVVGFAGVLFFFGVPSWLERTWFFLGAVLTVVVWQAVELFVFSKTRHQIYNDPIDARAGKDAHHE